MRESVPSARYSPICNVLRQWKTSLIPINFIESTNSMIIILHVMIGNSYESIEFIIITLY